MATTGGNLLQRTRCYYFYDTAFPCISVSPAAAVPRSANCNRIHAILGQSDAYIATHPSDMAGRWPRSTQMVQVHGRGALIPIGDLSPAGRHASYRYESARAIIAVICPGAGGCAFALSKIRDRVSYAFALVSAAAGTSGGRIREARMALESRTNPGAQERTG
jgi:xanthine dehydrogenase YagS FAD-binding subunit